MIVLNMLRRHVILLVDFDKEHATCFTVFGNVSHLGRAGIERPVVDDIVHMSVAEADIIRDRFQF